MNRYFFLVLFFLLFHRTCFSQKITGYVHSDQEAIIDANVLIKKGNLVLDFVFTDSQGKFQFNKTFRDTVVIEISSLNFKKEKIFFFSKKDTLIKVELFKNVISLDEVVFVKENKFSQKKDTISYNVNSFKDGTERVVENLLKKLPGISVNDDGKILFKNKEIEALMIEGDDLFNAQYVIGSKNIDIDLVESIEAIENFNTNKVLNKIIESEKVALNLKLKKDRTVLNLNVLLENDFYSKYNNSLTALLLDDLNKGFSTSSLNNIGNVASSNFIFSNKDNNQFSKAKNNEIISQGNYPTFLGNSNSLLNQSKYNYTSFFRNFTKKTKATFGFNYYEDKIRQDFIDRTNYKLATNNLDLFSTENQEKKPIVLSFNNTTTYNYGSEIQFENKLLIEANQSELNSRINNNNLLQRSNLLSKSLFVGNKSELTKQLSENSILNSVLFFSVNNSRQNFYITPGSPNIDSSSIKNTQKSNINSVFINSNIEFYKNWSLIKLKVSNSLEFQKDGLNTLLLNGENSLVNNAFLNDLVFKNLNNKLLINFIIKYKKSNLNFSTKFLFNKLYLSNTDSTLSDLLFNINYKYLINKKNSITFGYNEDVFVPKMNYMFNGFVLTSYRNLISNESKLDFIKNRDVKWSYNINDVYNTFYLNFGSGYSFADKDYYSINQITTELTYIKYLLLNYGNNRFYVDFSIHKLLPFIKTTIKFNSKISFSSSYNFVNDSELRNIKSKLLNMELQFYSGFKSKINFQGKITSQSSFFEVDKSNNALTQIINEFKVIYKISDKNNFKFELQTFIPDKTKNQIYSFMNFEYVYKFEKYNLETYIKGQNLLNVKKYEDHLVSDYAYSSFSYNLQERFVLFGIIYKVL